MLYIMFLVLILHTLRWVFRQWGLILNSKGASILFPLKFTSILLLLLTLQDDGIDSADAVNYKNLTTAGFDTVCSDKSSSFYFAIGR